MDTEILIVDDDPVVIHILSAILSSSGFTASSVQSDTAAFEFLRGRIDTDNLPDAIFLDLLLGTANGIEVLEQFRKMLGDTHIPVIMLSANTQEEMFENVNPVVLPDYYLQKPFKQDEVFAILKQALSTQS